MRIPNFIKTPHKTHISTVPDVIDSIVDYEIAEDFLETTFSYDDND